ncbi:MAG: hypothetical protein ABI347_02355 [Nitrososphaera sp.]
MPRIEYRCHACSQLFDTLGDMQRHIVVEHLQKADFVQQIGTEVEAA